jgi:hypothetical protein
MESKYGGGGDEGEVNFRAEPFFLLVMGRSRADSANWVFRR